MNTMQRIMDDGGGELIGYMDRWSAPPGEAVRLMVSTTAPNVRARVVRLRHGDPNPAGPGFRATQVVTDIDGEYPGHMQTINSGSCAVLENASGNDRTLTVWAWPTLPAAGRRQVIIARDGAVLYLDPDGLPVLRYGDHEVAATQRLRRERWVLLAPVLAPDRLALGVNGAVVSSDVACTPASGPIYLAAAPDMRDHYEGRLEAPCAFTRALTDDELVPEQFELLEPDRCWDLRAARLINAPTTAVTGRKWNDDTTDFRAAPDQYAAVHFHSDDLDDAAWEPMLELTIPDSLRSGVHAFELEAGGMTDHVPFIVRPPAGRPSARAGLLLPTLTYQVYGNERILREAELAMTPVPENPILDVADRWLDAHPEAGRSCYDHHPDGHGVSLVSQLRPIPNFRPSFVWWDTNSPERFGSDLYLVDWLDHVGVSYDTFTDHDLHAEGVGLLQSYDVILTGTHPEYCTRAMLDALRDYLEAGGRLMYLGGNGFYWVTSIDPERPHLAEVRRGINGTRAWSSRPGEQRHQTTGEQGGLWRYRGRDPNALVGVGFASQSDSPDRAPGYRRTEASYRPELSWIFEGVEGEMFGDYGLYLGGAAGYEIDRHDPTHGSPPESVVVATSEGLHPPSYLLVVEDMEATRPDVAGPDCSLVRADLTYLPYPNGGAVFSVGSCSWCGSLSHAAYHNDVSRITENVLRRFLGGQ